ncbi:MAG: hypothetical protein IJJ68_03320 [Prevotella sp.]|nr:hypothetical protein [Prevotella sp.]
MTIIYSNRQDDDCMVLQRIWRNIPNANIIEITPQSVDWEDDVDNAISNEEDTLILVGHGSPHGLYYPYYESGEYIIHENNVNLIHARNVVCCWCYASSFCNTHRLHSFSTSMFISNVNEAYDNGYYDYSQEQVNSVGIRFYNEINNFLINNVPLDEWVMRLGAHMDIEKGIDVFNRQGLMYI